MKWMRFRVRTRSEAEDILVSSMMDIGMYGAQIEDNVPLTASEKEQMFVDILPQAREDDGTAVLSFYVEETERGTVLIDGAEKTGDQVRRDMEGVIANLRVWTGDSGIDIGEGTVSVEETEDIDWINNWKQYFHQFWIDDILVIPSWEQPEQEDGDRSGSLRAAGHPGEHAGQRRGPGQIQGHSRQHDRRAGDPGSGRL